MRRRRLVIIGGGMAAYKLVELLTDSRGGEAYAITLVGEEPRPPYDRVHLTEYLSGRSAEELFLQPLRWYKERGIRLLTSRRAVALDREARRVGLDDGRWLAYDLLVLATGSRPFVPPVSGTDAPGVYVYRTIEDLDGIRAHAQHATRAGVLGGGLLGLEAARALRDLGLDATVIEANDRLMPRQLDHGGARLLQREIEALGVRVLLERFTERIEPAEDGLRLYFHGEHEPLPIDLLVISAGIRPRDELARSAGLEVHPRGGILVDDTLTTSDPAILAIGECAVHDDRVYGLVGPCYQMAEVVAARLLGMEKRFTGADTSTQLKLLGVDVATVGDSVPPPEAIGRSLTAITVADELAGVYRKLIVDKETKRLRGAILVGDKALYGRLVGLYRSGQPLPETPIDLIVDGGTDLAGDDALVCTCNNVTEGAIREAIAQGAASIAEIGACTGAGSGCGGCKPQVKAILVAELARQGRSVRQEICEHFPYTRRELVDIVRVKGLRSFDAVLEAAGRGAGCEVCKPVVASILTSLTGQTAIEQPTIQDTNDRFLANIQRGGTYSVVPRIPGGEITPRQLKVIAEVAERYDLYVKLTGGQRIDLFGARIDDLPKIWEELIAAGFESGHAYAKGMRTVKSCVGSTWCRFGVLDSVGFAIRLEHRYKGLRAPHKLKAAVSGCIRECAEARSKDFGVIATEEGWNLYVGGNGGANPRHAELLAAGLDDETCIRYIDRFLMYYILTAEPLQRTAHWLENLENGIETLREVVVEDKLGIAADLEAQLAATIANYKCEWRQVLEDPEKRKLFRSYANLPEDAPDPTVVFVRERDQKRPASGGGFVELQRIGRLDLLTEAGQLEGGIQ